jgi:hypothetical protein
MFKKNNYLKHPQATVDTPRKRFCQALVASRRLRSDACKLGHDRVDRYYEDVESDWLEKWQEQP